MGEAAAVIAARPRVQQIGAMTPSLDPSIQNFTTFGHLTQPQANTTQSRTSALIEDVHTYNTTVVQRLVSGGTFQYRASSST